MYAQLQDSIHTLSIDCVRAFDKLLESLIISPEEFRLEIPTEEVENDFGRFKIWCGNLGALQKGRSSLDVRLRDAVIMRDTVTRFLSQLRESLNQCVEITSGNRPPWEKQNDFSISDIDTCRQNDESETSVEHMIDDMSVSSDEGVAELAVRHQEIRDSIKHLNRLSFRLRDANYRVISSKALSLKHLDPETGVDQFSIFAEYDYQYVLEKLHQLRQPEQKLNPNFPQRPSTTSAPPEFLLARLSKAITNRRRYFTYWHRHSLKLQAAPEQLSTLPKEPGKSREQGLSARTPGQEAHKSGRSSAPSSIQIPGTILSATEFSRYRNNLDEQIDAASIATYATAARDADGTVATLPLPPINAKLETEFVCPYCWVLCPAKQGQGRRWRAHVLQDLQPYVCTYPECTNGDYLYSSQVSWMEHERLCHRRVWRCSDKQHISTLYSSSDQLLHHLRLEHSNLTEIQMQQLADTAHTTVADTRKVCPFCNQGPFDEGLSNHMAVHQEQLATFAAPRNVGDDVDGSANSGNAHGNDSSRASFSTILDLSMLDDGHYGISTTPLTDDVVPIPDVETQAPLESLTIATREEKRRDTRETDDALWKASFEGNEEMVKTLLERGADVDAHSTSKIRSSPLQTASSEGHESVVKALLDYGADVDAKSGGDTTALYAAALKGFGGIVKMLLGKGADTNTESGLHGTALQAASFKGHEEIARMLLDRCADINAKGGESGSALAAASINCNKDIVKLLLERGADVDMACGSFGTALSAAASKDHMEIVELLLARNADINKGAVNYGTALNVAIMHRSQAVVDLLLQKGADIHHEGGDFNNAIGFAAYKGNREVFDLLLDQGADIHLQGKFFNNAIGAAAAGGNNELIELLIARGADVHKRGGAYGNALGAAAHDGRRWTVELLLEKGADLTVTNDGGQTPLYFAARNGHTGVARLLLDHMADPNTNSSEGETPLLAAVKNGHLKTVDLLAEHGADCSTFDKNGWSPLIAAADRGNVDAVGLLLSNGSNPGSANLNGWTALLSASFSGYDDVVMMLLDKGADIMQATNSDWTSLHAASDKGHVQTVTILLRRGAVIKAVSKLGWTPLHAAAASGHLEVAKILLSADADLIAHNGLPIYLAAVNNHPDMVRFLLGRGAFEASHGKVDIYETIANMFAFKGSVDLLRSIVQDHKVDLHQLDRHNRSLLHLAARGGQMETFQFLTGQGLRGNEPDAKGDSLISYAAAGGSEAILRTVIEDLPQPARQVGRWTPLHWACRAGNVKNIELLVASGWKSKSVEVPELQQFWTPFDIAIFHGNADIANNLSQHCQTVLSVENISQYATGQMIEGVLCDGCIFDLYGSRWRCRTCDNFDYCFMCKFSLEHLHQNHDWEYITPSV